MGRTLKQPGFSPREAARRLAEERLRLGLSRAEVARRMDALEATIVDLETVANPQLSRLVKLAEAGYRIERVFPELFPGRVKRARSAVRSLDGRDTES